MNMSGDPFSISASIAGFSADDPNTNPNPKPAPPSGSVAKKRRNQAGTPGKLVLFISLLISPTSSSVTSFCNFIFSVNPFFVCVFRYLPQLLNAENPSLTVDSLNITELISFMLKY